MSVWVPYGESRLNAWLAGDTGLVTAWGSPGLAGRGGRQQYDVPLCHPTLPAGHTITRLGGSVAGASGAPSSPRLVSYNGWVHEQAQVHLEAVGSSHFIAMPPQACLGCTWAPTPPVNALVPDAVAFCQPVMGCAAVGLSAAAMTAAVLRLGMAVSDGCCGVRAGECLVTWGQVHAGWLCAWRLLDKVPVLLQEEHFLPGTPCHVSHLAHAHLPDSEGRWGLGGPAGRAQAPPVVVPGGAPAAASPAAAFFPRSLDIPVGWEQAFDGPLDARFHEQALAPSPGQRVRSAVWAQPAAAFAPAASAPAVLAPGRAPGDRVPLVPVAAWHHRDEAEVFGPRRLAGAGGQGAAAVPVAEGAPPGGAAAPTGGPPAPIGKSGPAVSHQRPCLHLSGTIHFTVFVELRSAVATSSSLSLA